MNREEYSSDYFAKNVRQAIAAGNTEQALENLETMATWNRVMYEGLVDMLSSALTFVAKREGEGAVEDALRYLAKDVWNDQIAMLRDGKVSVDQWKAYFTMGNCAHCQDLVVEEDEDKIVWIHKNCGVWHRLAREGKLDNSEGHPMNLGTVKKSYPWSGGQTGMPYYCAHAPLWFNIINKELGYEALEFAGWEYEPDCRVPKYCKSVLHKRPKNGAAKRGA